MLDDNKMKNHSVNDDSELDDELIKSLEKLVEEETNVAKAFVDNQKSANHEEISSGLGHTKTIPVISRDMLEDNDGIVFEDDSENDFTTQRKSTIHTDSKDRVHSQEKPKKGADKKTKFAIIAICCGVIAVIAGILIVALVMDNNKKNSYSYNYDKGMACYNNKEYKTALHYLNKASKDNKGKRNIELKYTIYECYRETGDSSAAVEILKDILSYEKDSERAIKSLAALYYQQKDGGKLTELIRSYSDSDSLKYLLEYIVSEPKPSIEAGEYDDTVSLQLTADEGCVIYYTTDKSEPTLQSTRYGGDVIEIGNGTTTIKAVAVNEVGVYSNIAVMEYVVDYKKPDMPSISPASGTYEEGQKITVDNIPEGCKAYYTLDGTTPSKNSTEYTGEIEMPAGNTVVSVVIIDSHEQSSSVAKRNYIVNVTKPYTYAEALNIIKNKFIDKGIIEKDGKTAMDGSSVSFVFQSKITVDSIEMYLYRYDIIKMGVTSTVGYYGVGIKNGTCYEVTQTNGTYEAKIYQ